MVDNINKKIHNINLFEQHMSPMGILGIIIPLASIDTFVYYGTRIANQICSKRTTMMLNNDGVVISKL